MLRTERLPAGAPAVVARSALVMFGGLVLVAFVVALLAVVSPTTVTSRTFPATSVIATELVQCLTAIWAGRMAWRRLSETEGLHRHLMTATGPVAVVLTVNVLGIALAGTPWWRLLLDLAVTALGASLHGLKVTLKQG